MSSYEERLRLMERLRHHPNLLTPDDLERIELESVERLGRLIEELRAQEAAKAPKAAE